MIRRSGSLRVVLPLALLAGGFGGAAAAAPGGPPGALPPELMVSHAPSWAPWRGQPPSSVIFPEQQLGIRFTHRVHLKKGVKCLDCHDKAAESTSAKDDLLPKEDSCADCHAIDRAQPQKQAKPAARCSACHVATDGKGFDAAPGQGLARVQVPEPNLKFPHKAHVSRQIPCERCHGDLRQVELATRMQLPRMPLCLECHDGKTAPSKCTTCHLATPDGRVRTVFTAQSALGAPVGTLKLIPSGVLRGDAHTPRFRTEHAKVAQSQDTYCATCHKRSFCLDCHNSVVKPFDFHGNDYVTLHALDARKNDPDCSSCHRRQTFCLGCHQRVGVAIDPAGGNPSGTRTGGFGPAFGKPGTFHPANWARDSMGAPSGRVDPNHHSFQAQRNIRACASCHREETCMRCHSSGKGMATGGRPPQDTTPGVREPGYNQNPHGPDFKGGRCKSLASRNMRVCVKCHDPRDAALSCN